MDMDIDFMTDDLDLQLMGQAETMMIYHDFLDHFPIYQRN